MSPSTAVCSILAFVFLLSTTHADPISKILEAYPDFSKLNELLVLSGIDKLIDNQPSVTVLALNNDEIEKLSGLKKPIEMEKIIMAHVALDYYDDVKLRHLNFGQIREMSTLLQLNGTTLPKQGLLKVTRTQEGVFFQSSGMKPNPGDAKFVDRIFARQFNISILKLDHAIYIDGLTNDLVPAIIAPVSSNNATAPVAEAPEVVVDASSEDLPDESIAPSEDAESPDSADANEEADAKSSAGKVTFGLASLIMATSCIAAAL